MKSRKSNLPSLGVAEPLPAAPFVDPRGRRPRERLLEAVLQVSGERGYETIAVKHIIESAGTSRGTFYNHFKDKEDCFVQAYVEASEWLFARLRMIALRQPSWREGLRASLADLLEFCANNPAIAKSLFIEAHAVGGEALAQHDRLLDRLARGIDSAREAADISREEGDFRAPPPAVTSAFTVGAIEALITAKLSSDEAERVPELLPGILHFAVMQYRGKDAAWEEMTSAPLATWEARRRAAAEVP